MNQIQAVWVSEINIPESIKIDNHRLKYWPAKTGKTTNLIALDSKYNTITLPPIEQITSLSVKYVDTLRVKYVDTNSIMNQADHKLNSPYRIEQFINLTSLDLSKNRLTILPHKIGNLTELTSLDLSDNQLKNFPHEIENLAALVFLDLSKNQLTSLFEKIEKFTNLTTLDLSYNRLKNLPIEIEKLTKLAKLTSLNLSGNQISNLPAEIGKLTKLTALNLSDNQLTKLPSEIGKIINLRELKICRNNLVELPDEIGQISNLQILDVDCNQLINIPAEIGQLKKLSWLRLTKNPLTSLPKEINQLKNLSLDLDNVLLTNSVLKTAQFTSHTTFHVNNQSLINFPDEIKNLVNLNLDLSNNLLTSIPKWIFELTNLQSLNLSRNKLEDLPAEIVNLTNLSSLELYGNPLSSLPPEIRKKSGMDILNFCRQQIEQETDYLYEAKLLVIGEGGAGKTTLTRKINNPEYELKDEDSTQGIDVIRWKFPLGKSKEFRVNIWDFGGQEIYHATHQFFLTKRSLYILVADSRKEDTDFYYWLNIVELLSDNSPLLIINNEKQDRRREINERQLRGEFTNLKETLSTNLSKNHGLDEILNQIKHYIATLPHVGNELPKNWIKVRESLEQNPRNHIGLEEYLQICQGNSFTRREDKLQLSSYLHDLGVCLHFQEDDLLIKTVILKPNWGTDAVYKVLDNSTVIQNQGKFTRHDLNKIWHEDKYADMRPELLRLMINFKLCYEIPSCPGIYIAPQLLTPNQPEYDWTKSDNLLLRYEYEFMPKGILTRFIVEMHNWIENQTNVWKTGVVLSQDNTRAEIIERYRYHKGEIRIRVSGKRKRDLLTTIRHELGKIHNSFERLKYKTQVPCNCPICKGQQSPYFYSLERLYKFLETGKATIQCYESGEDVSVKGLIDDVDSTPNSATSSTSKNQPDSRVTITQTYNGPVFGAVGQAQDQHIHETPSE
jgi:internalin A